MGKIGVILGCGYVGSAVARQWMAEGVEVWGVSRNAETLSQIQGEGFHPVVAEVDDVEWHDQVPAEPDFVLNCVSSAALGIEGYRKSYLGGNESLLRWARNRKPGKVIYTGSTAVYPFTDGREVWEDDAGGDLSDTGEVVLESEKMLLEDAELGPRASVLRLAGIYGPGRHHLLDQVQKSSGVLPGRGDYYLNLIFLDDIVSAVMAVFASGKSGGRVYNLADGNSPTKEEMVAWLADRIGCPVPVFDPNATGGRRMRVNRAGGSPNRRVKIDRIRSEVGWEPAFPSFREGFTKLGY
ncbi:NAD-dependent epimerase/dehydratase family protein [Puniceicoccus vermicola]|uniref:NAD-dependent epimerase/dehydratase family protein n=1 Tax=Puniceicoccus vermicola TaxID=388746 RepID=A0A7X1B4F3_9BACT|nr:NAD-dependent epimerase/dehydratase family protein [Puniceicoccus vermicola]MBC2604200.1 NAD-dependent epimerase/dehydratase family protein [Puniceicoccus vermicola]